MNASTIHPLAGWKHKNCHKLALLPPSFVNSIFKRFKVKQIFKKILKLSPVFDQVLQEADTKVWLNMQGFWLREMAVRENVEEARGDWRSHQTMMRCGPEWKRAERKVGWKYPYTAVSQSHWGVLGAKSAIRGVPCLLGIFLHLLTAAYSNWWRAVHGKHDFDTNMRLDFRARQQGPGCSL